MQLAKHHLDIGLFTNNKDEMLRFWQDDIGLKYDHLGKLGGGVHQHRHFLGNGPTGPILKINHARDTLIDACPSGFRCLMIARDDISKPVKKTDPDGNLVTLVPKGYQGIATIGVRVITSSLNDFQQFYGSAMGFPQIEGTDRISINCGETVLIAELGDNLSKDIPYKAKGYRYLTAQIFDADTTHKHIIELGGTEGAPPRTLGTTVRFSFVRDVDGNWIELSERATLTGKAV